jgi:hypothetical protein
MAMASPFIGSRIAGANTALRFFFRISFHTIQGEDRTSKPLTIQAFPLR